MRVALLSPRSPVSNAAGIEQNIHHVSHYLSKKGVNVEVFCTTFHAQRTLTRDGISIHEFPAFAPKDNYFLSTPLYHALRKWEGGIVHCNGYNNLVSVVGIMAKKKNQKLVFTLNSSGSSSRLRELLHIPLAWFYHFNRKKIDHLVCVSKWEHERLAPTFGLNKKDVSIIPNGISLSEFKKKGKRKKGKILSVGRLVKNKGMHHLIAAFAHVQKEMPEAQLHIVGEGPQREELEQQAHALGLKSNVFFHGNIGFEERETLLEHYRTASLFSLLTEYESQGIVFAEAAAAGLPMAIPNKGVMREYVEAGLAEGIQDGFNSEEVSRVLVRLLRKKRSAKKPSLKPLIWDWKEVGAAVHHLYQKLEKES
jgi:glycosyltransferase involved in cell wall biosynthesis